MRLADVTPSTAAFYRCVYALPPLLGIALVERRRYGPRERPRAPARVDRRLFFAADLILWHHSIAAVGAGWRRCSANVQVVLVPIRRLAVPRRAPGARVVARCRSS